jgi:hypothetical protein
MSKMKNRLLYLILFLGLIPSGLLSQGTAGYTGSIEPQYIIDKPTAGLIGKHNLGINIDFYQNGGILAAMNFGIFDILDVGLSFGGYNIIGSEDVKWNKLPGVKLKLRAIEEKANIPAVAIGFESQGKELYVEGSERYLIKSPGFYVVASKNFSWLGYISYHLGLNYSLENDDSDKDLNMYLGLEKTIGDYVSFNAEYDFAFNDDTKAYGQGKGYLNLSLKWFIGNGVTLSFAGKNLLNNKKYEKVGTRIIGIELIQLF